MFKAFNHNGTLIAEAKDAGEILKMAQAYHYQTGNAYSIEEMQAIGANCEIIPYMGADYNMSAYISFGKYDQENDADSFGVPDHKIFFYAEGEEGLKSLMLMDVMHPDDFTVLNYELEYQNA